MKPVRYDPNGRYNGVKLMGFKGHWGNRKRGCGIIEKILKTCMLDDGPEEVLPASLTLNKKIGAVKVVAMVTITSLKNR